MIHPLDLQFSASTAKTQAPYLRANLRKAIALVPGGKRLRELSIAIVGTAAMAKLHQQFMDIAGATDVLTFELEHNAAGQCVAGEIVICAPVAARQARLHHHAVKHELLLYALHGVLHLCGYDDKIDAAYNTMHHLEDHILAKLGIGPIFGAMANAECQMPNAKQPPPQPSPGVPGEGEGGDRLSSRPVIAEKRKS